MLKPDEETKDNEEVEEQIETMDDLFQSVMLRSSLAKQKPTINGHQVTSIVIGSAEDPFVVHNLGKVCDVDHPRLELPSINTFKLSPSTLFKLIKDLIGKELSRISLPVFMNEPFSVLQKAGEIMYYVSKGMILAAEETDPCR